MRGRPLFLPPAFHLLASAIVGVTEGGAGPVGARCDAVAGASCAADDAGEAAFLQLKPVSAELAPPLSRGAGKVYDVIIVGGGLVGSVVAAELSSLLKGRSVLLLEAGRRSQAVLGGVDKPASWNGTTKNWDLWPGFEHSPLTRFDVPGNYGSLPCWDTSCPESWGRKVPAFQCKVLGGCGAMNGALMQKPHRDMFDAWPKGWRADDLKPYYDAAASMYNIDPTPSKDGEHYLDNTGGNFVRTALLHAGFEEVDSVLEPSAGTLGVPEVAAKDGVRRSSAAMLLPTAVKRENFELRVETEVTKILHQNGRASGVSVASARGTQEEVMLAPGGIVVTSAGALNTPRLLLASGITGGGAVGRGVTDHSLNMLVYKILPSAGPTALSGASEGMILAPPSASTIVYYLATKSGPLAQFGPTFVAFLRSPETQGPAEIFDVEVWVNPSEQAREAHVNVVLMRPRCSNGDLSLGADGNLQMSGPVLAGPGCEKDRAILDWAIGYLDQWLGKSGAQRVDMSPVYNMNHWAGSCALGKCVSTDTLRVMGMQNVAVADASLLPGQVWGHPAFTLTALGLKVAATLTASVM